MIFTWCSERCTGQPRGGCYSGPCWTRHPTRASPQKLPFLQRRQKPVSSALSLCGNRVEGSCKLTGKAKAWKRKGAIISSSTRGLVCSESLAGMANTSASTPSHGSFLLLTEQKRRGGRKWAFNNMTLYSAGPNQGCITEHLACRARGWSWHLQDHYHTHVPHFVTNKCKITSIFQDSPLTFYFRGEQWEIK